MKKLIFVLLFCVISLCSFAQREVCGASFGCSYGATKIVLQNKFGACDYSDKNEITYYNKTYGGIFFSRIIFEFQYDLYGRSYFNSCIMACDCASVTEACVKAKRLAFNALSKYNMEEHTNKDGKTYYLGGVDPTDSSQYGIMVYTAKWSNGCGAAIAYGPYNYVKEEF